MKAAAGPAPIERLGGAPSRGCQRDDGPTAGPGSGCHPLLHYPDGRRHDQDAVDGSLEEQAGGTFEAEPGLSRTRARVDEHRQCGAEHGLQGIFLPAAQRVRADGYPRGDYLLGGALADALAPVAGHAQDLQVLHRGGAAG